MPEEPGARYVAVIGPADASAAERVLAQQVGRLLAERGAVVVCGGLGGVMEAVCEGARRAGGVTIGLLPGSEHGAGNPYLSVEIPTGLGQARNALVIGAAHTVIAVGGSWGTLSEVSLAMRAGKPVCQLAGGWPVGVAAGVPVPRPAATPAHAVSAALARHTDRPERTAW